MTEAEIVELAKRVSGWLNQYGVVVIVTNQTPENRAVIERDFDKLEDLTKRK